MEIIGLILATIGILLAFPGPRRELQLFFLSCRKLWIVNKCKLSNTEPLALVEAIEKGVQTSTTNDFMICDWNHKLLVQVDGNTETSVECLLVNISKEIKKEITFPVYFDGPPAEIAGWAKIGATEYPLELTDWDSKNRRGLFVVTFPHTLKPRDDILLRWGYVDPSPAYAEGHEWWEWYIARPHAQFRVRITFGKQWKVSNAIGLIHSGDHEPAQPKLRKGVLYWRINAPITGAKYRLEFDISRT